MNDAFKRLQSVVPDVLPEADKSDQAAKLSKINTLKLAVNYISALTQMLKQTESNSNFEKGKFFSGHGNICKDKLNIGSLGRPTSGGDKLTRYKTDLPPTDISYENACTSTHDNPVSNSLVAVNNFNTECSSKAQISFYTNETTSGELDYLNSGAHHFKGDEFASNENCIYANSNQSTLSATNFKSTVPFCSTTNLDNMFVDFDALFEDFDTENLTMLMN